MKVGELRAMLDGVDDDLEVVDFGSDHSYSSVNVAGTVKAEKNNLTSYGNPYSEYYEEQGIYIEGNTVEDVFLVGSF